MLCSVLRCRDAEVVVAMNHANSGRCGEKVSGEPIHSKVWLVLLIRLAVPDQESPPGTKKRSEQMSGRVHRDLICFFVSFVFLSLYDLISRVAPCRL